MARLYVTSAFAKMTGMPDNLTETPHTYAQREPFVDVLTDILDSMRLSGGVVVDGSTRGDWCLLSQFNEDDRASMVAKRFGQGIAQARPADVERVSPLLQEVADASRRRALLMKDGQDGFRNAPPSHDARMPGGTASCRTAAISASSKPNSRPIRQIRSSSNSCNCPSADATT